MRRCSRFQTAITRNASTLIVVVGLIGAAGCASPARNLSDPAKFRTIEHALRTDLTKVVHDLQRERVEADAGARGSGESPCYNLKNNVNFVVLTTIRSFVLGTVTADRNSMQNNINHIRSDRSGFEKDMFDFVNDGVPRPAGADRTVKEITKKIDDAETRANHTISEVNGLVRQAYHIANGLASGRCIGDGPGNQMPRVAPVV